jgi:IS30 family transposase
VAISDETRAEFFELVCGGSIGMRTASLRLGVSAETGRQWWLKSGLVSVPIVKTRHGGLAGSAPVSRPGVGTERRQLTSEDRAVIAAGRRAGWSYARIGQEIGRDKSVVSREVARNRGRDGSYYGAVAHRAAHERRRRPKPFKLVINAGLCRRIEDWMDQGWSPGLIAAVLKSEKPANKMECVSHETIYQALYVQTRGQLRADLSRQLSLRRAQRKTPGTRTRSSDHMYREAFTISQRPAEAADRAVPGHWEGDLVLGSAGGSAVGSLVERSTRFTILLHLPQRHDAESVAEAMIQQMRRLPEHLRRSITWDRGRELAAYERVQLELGTPVYFCDPHSPWQRGTNENTNRLLRFWLEKGTNLATYSAKDLETIADTLNRRPRPTLDLQTPAQRLNELLNRAA